MNEIIFRCSNCDFTSQDEDENVVYRIRTKHLKECMEDTANFLCSYCFTWFEANDLEEIRKIKEDHLAGCLGKESEVVEYGRE